MNELPLKWTDHPFLQCVPFSLSGAVSVAFHDITEIFMTSPSKSRQRHAKHVCCWLHSCEFKFMAQRKTAPPGAFALLFMMWISWRHGLFLTGWPSGFFFLFFLCPRWQRYNNLPMKNGINHPDFTTRSCLFAKDILQIETMLKLGCFFTRHPALVRLEQPEDGGLTASDQKWLIQLESGHQRYR